MSIQFLLKSNIANESKNVTVEEMVRKNTHTKIYTNLTPKDYKLSRHRERQGEIAITKEPKSPKTQNPTSIKQHILSNK